MDTFGSLPALPARRAGSRPWRPRGCDNIALVLQGGGALGAYQAGIYQALDEAGLVGRVKAQGNVGFARRQIKNFVGDNDVQQNVGIGLMKDFQTRRQPGEAERFGHGHSQGPSRVGLVVFKRFDGVRKTRHGFLRVAVEIFAVFGQRQTAAVAQEERQTEFIFERHDARI